MGQTCRAIYIRIKEHLACVRHKRNTSSFAMHIFNNEHIFDSDNVSYLHCINKGVKLNIAENLEIFLSAKHRTNLNDQTQFDTNNFFAAIDDL